MFAIYGMFAMCVMVALPTKFGTLNGHNARNMIMRTVLATSTMLTISAMFKIGNLNRQAFRVGLNQTTCGSIKHQTVLVMVWCGEILGDGQTYLGVQLNMGDMHAKHVCISIRCRRALPVTATTVIRSYPHGSGSAIHLFTFCHLITITFP